MKTAKTTTLECEKDGERLDVFLAANLSGLTRSAAQKLIDSGRVTLGGVSLRKSHRTSFGEIYIVTQDEPDEPAAMPQDIPLDIVYEDADVIVVNKQRGMVVHPAPGHPDGTLVNALLGHCGGLPGTGGLYGAGGLPGIGGLSETGGLSGTGGLSKDGGLSCDGGLSKDGGLSGIGGVKRPGIVHRIDKDTSGLLIAAKNDRAHLALAAQLSARTLTREYDAVVCGTVKNDSGTVSVPIGRHNTDRKRQAANGRHPRHAVTHFDVVARYGLYTHVHCRLETGRTHQIRVHMAYIGHPLLGDAVYGHKKPELGLSGQCLHASKIRFIHPSTRKDLEFCAGLPGYFLDVLAKLESRQA